ncbi:peptidylprolyl isomerase [Salegentibacter chungangensis]|uniref:Periplasmic chaperone PpiD n=1 Tax=Salegentibacter chungangensis TaxID=1335724 RepID=A0ABW3NNC7_9FLAO
MAVLNKIRQRSVFLIVIIALALFAFVLADVIRNGGLTSQKSQNVIATVNGEEIEREEFARQVESLQRNMGPNASTTQVVNRVWDQKLREVIIKEQLEELGVRAEEAHIKQVLRSQMANNPNFTNEAGMFDENKLKEYIASLKANSPQAYQQWVSYENSLEETARQNIYMNMVSAGVGATLKEGEQAYRMQNDNIDLKFVQIPYSSVADSQAEISKDEIRAYVKEHPAKFETEEARNIQYVYFEETASTKDKEESKTAITSMKDNRIEYNAATSSNDTLPGFDATEDIEEFVNTNSDIPYDNRFVFKNQLPKKFADDIFSLQEGETFGPYEDNGYWKLTKMVETKQIPDSVKASHILVSYKGNQFPGLTRTKEEAKALADSLVGVVKAGNTDFAELATEFSADPSNQENGGDLGWIQPGMMIPDFEDFVFESNEGEVGVVETDLGFHVVSVEEQTDREKAVKVATIAREIEASERTRNNLFNEVTKFEIASGKEGFNEKAKASGYDVRTVKDIKALDENIPGVGAQRRVVQWAFEEDAKVGDIKRFETPNGYIVAQLTAKKDAGLMSAEDASSVVIPILTKQKKAEIIKEKISGNSLEEIAQNNNTSVKTADAVNLNSPTLAGAGSEPEVVGAVFGLEKGQMSKPVAGEKGVYVVEVVNKNEAPAMETYKGFADQETMRRRRAAAARAYQALKSKAEIEDNRAKFY